MWRAIIITAFIVAMSAACTDDKQRGSDRSRQESVKAREEVLRQAEAVYPVPPLQNFPGRRALVKFTERQDLINHPFYVYILGDNGNVVGYYIAQTRPINSCNFLSSTERIVDRDIEGSLIVTAPSLDGMFYGGGGAAAGCDAWFFFDAATDAMIEIRGVKFFTADSRLD